MLHHSHTTPPRPAASSITASPPLGQPLLAVPGYRCNFQARALYTRRGCRQIQEFTVEVFEISRQSLRLRSALASFLPDSFTLILGARQYGIGCCVVGRVKNTVRCNLIRRETDSMVAYLSTLRDPRTTLLPINDPSFPRGIIVLNR